MDKFGELEEDVGEVLQQFTDVLSIECKRDLPQESVREGRMDDGEIFVCGMTFLYGQKKIPAPEVESIKIVGATVEAKPEGITARFNTPATCTLYDFFGEKSMICKSDYEGYFKVLNRR